MQLLTSPCLNADLTARGASHSVSLPAAQPVLNQVDSRHSLSSISGAYLSRPLPNINPDDEFPRRTEISNGRYILQNNGTKYYTGASSRSTLGSYTNVGSHVSCLLHPEPRSFKQSLDMFIRPILYWSMKVTPQNTSLFKL